MDANKQTGKVASDIQDIIGIDYDGQEVIHFDHIKEKLFGLATKKTSLSSNNATTNDACYKNENNNTNSDSNVGTSIEFPNADRIMLGSYCDYCDFRPKIRKPSILEIHMKIHTGDKPFPCSVCDFSTASKYYLEVHMRTHTGEKPFECQQCDRRFSRKDMLKRHLTTHVEEKAFSCTECNFKCAQKKGLYQHWRSHCKFKHFKCSECDFDCRTAVHLKDHMLIHPKIYSCSKCDYIGRCVKDLEKHNCITVTTDSQSTKYIRMSMRPSTCSQCDKVFHSKSNLAKHLKKNICIKGRNNS